MKNDNSQMNIDQVLNIMEDMIQQVDKKVKSGRIKDLKKEELRLKLIRSQAYLCKTYVEIREARKVEELEEELELIKKQLEKSK